MRIKHILHIDKFGKTTTPERRGEERVEWDILMTKDSRTGNPKIVMSQLSENTGEPYGYADIATFDLEASTVILHADIDRVYDRSIFPFGLDDDGSISCTTE